MASLLHPNSRDLDHRAIAAEVERRVPHGLALRGVCPGHPIYDWHRSSVTELVRRQVIDEAVAQVRECLS